MKRSSFQLLPTAVAACISLMFFVTPTQGASIVIGGNYTDIGTITFVGPRSGDSPTTAGTRLLNVLAGIEDNSATNPYLIKLGPGIYDLDIQSFQMKEYVDLEGSGENVTIIRGFNIEGVVQGANHAEIRFLKVQHTGGKRSFASAIRNNNLDGHIGPLFIPSSFRMTHMTASASGEDYVYGVQNTNSSPTMTNVTATASGGIYGNYAVYNDSSSPTMANVTAKASGEDARGVVNLHSSTTMTNVTASASGGTINYGVSNSGSGIIRIDHSVIKGTTNTISNSTGVTTRVGNTQLDGGDVSNSGTLTCVGAYDENYVALDTSCQ